jgi:hypothetical protein
MQYHIISYHIISCCSAQVERIRAAVEKGDEVEATILNYRKDQSTFMNRLKIAPILGVDKRPILLVGVQQLVENHQPSSAADG